VVELSQAFGKYRLLKKLARGGMAEIFLASREDVAPADRLVVIKRVLRGFSDSPDSLKMFLDEARIVARLNHPHIVRIFDLGQIDGQYYIAMEYIAGEDQRSVFDQAIALKQQIPFGYVAEIILGAAEALTSAHQVKDADGRPLRLVHRDVTPSNLLATWQGSVKLVDFGIARTETNISKTDAGTVKGKVRYLSPEQVRSQRVDHRTDLYALGVVLYELLTCLKAFARDSPFATVKAITSGDVPPVESIRPGVPPALVAVVKRAMSVDLAQRYQSGAELVADLNAFLETIDWMRGVDSVEFLSSMFGDARKAAKLRLASGQQLDEDGYAALDTARPQPLRPRPQPLDFRPPKTLTTEKLRPRAALRVPLGAVESSGTASTVDHTDPDQAADGEEISTEPSRRRPDDFPLDAASEFDAGTEEPKTLPMTSGLPLLREQTTRQMRPADEEPKTTPFHSPVYRGKAPPILPGLPPLLDVEPPTSGAALSPLETREDDEADPRTSIDPRPTGGLRLRGVPAGARLTINGMLFGTPLEEHTLAVGTHHLVIDAPGFQHFEQTVELEMNEVVELKVELKKR
jgi:eukaryotic-like serine/threonine-protein kinase